MDNAYTDALVKGKYSDIDVCVNEKNYKLHKIVLGQVEWFKRYINGGWIETIPDKKAELIITFPDTYPITNNGFERFLRFLYGHVFGYNSIYDPPVLSDLIEVYSICNYFNYAYGTIKFQSEVLQAIVGGDITRLIKLHELCRLPGYEDEKTKSIRRVISLYLASEWIWSENNIEIDNEMASDLARTGIFVGVINNPREVDVLYPSPYPYVHSSNMVYGKIETRLRSESMGRRTKAIQSLLKTPEYQIHMIGGSFCTSMYISEDEIRIEGEIGNVHLGHHSSIDRSIIVRGIYTINSQSKYPIVYTRAIAVDKNIGRMFTFDNYQTVMRNKPEYNRHYIDVNTILGRIEGGSPSIFHAPLTFDEISTAFSFRLPDSRTSWIITIMVNVVELK